VRRKLPVVLLAFATSFATAMPIAFAEEPGTGDLGQNLPVVEDGEYNSYIVVMEDDPLIADIPQDSLDGAAAQTAAAALEQSHEAAMTEAGLDSGDIVNSYVNSLNGFSALITHAEAERLAATSKVALVIPDELLQHHTDSSAEFIGLTGRGGAYAAGYTGKGVVVGVIDTGIWPEHPSFADKGLPTPSILPLDATDHPVCDFGNDTANPADLSFTCNNKLIGARQMLDTYRAVIGPETDEGDFDSARDSDGHGTHTASTAAGNANVRATAFGERVGRISGIAPDAHIIAYKGLGLQGGFTSDLAAAIDQAVFDGVDVINYSIGGGANLTGVDDIAFLFAAEAGVFVATSAGNEGPGPETVGSPGVVPWITTVGANTQERFFQGRVTVGSEGSRSWRYRKSFVGASLTLGTDGSFPLVDAEFAGGDLCIPGTLDPAVVEGAVVLCRRGAVGRADKSFAVFDAGGVGMVLYNETDDDNLFTDPHSVPSVHIDLTPGLRLKQYIADTPNPVAKITTGDVTRWRSAPGMTIFSSRGPNPVAPDIIKPDVTAPGLQILAGASPVNVGYVQGELFQAIAGTSMSSPHVAGVFALIKQAHPDWSAAMAKSALMTTADTDVVDNDRKSQANPFEMGAGMIDPGGNQKNSAFNPGLVYDAGFVEYLGFLCDAGPEVFLNPAATCGSLAASGVPILAYDLNVPSIGVSEVPGTRTIVRTVTNVSSQSIRVQADVKKPKGFDVTVSPRRLTVPAGGSATFEVTFTTTDAPIGEWRFGSLTWKGSGYEVRSPIAAKAAQIEVPEVLTGAGETGSVSIPVSFGYTGAYAASPHGLVPAVLTVDNVLQDAGQIFDPADVTAGGANAHMFDLSAGAVVFKIAMPPEATEPDADLDIFVYDPDGIPVAASTSGGTDEEVVIENPAPGIWTVYVHGWSAPGGDSDYTMYTWAVPATTGGTLVVDSSPPSAVSGTTGTVEASWSGATLGEWHLGAVSHSDGSGVIDLTLLDIDNRS
jgi:subtilisin family serine protease